MDNDKTKEPDLSNKVKHNTHPTVKPIKLDGNIMQINHTNRVMEQY